MNSIILHGGGEHASVVLDCFDGENDRVIGIFDLKVPGKLIHIKYFGPYDPLIEPQARTIATIGDNRIRKKAVLAMKHNFISCAHHSALISSTVRYGEGCMILHGVIIQANSEIGNHVIVNTGAKIDHDCKIGDFVHIAPSATLCGMVSINEGALIGAGAVVLPGIKVGKWAVVGAGSVVTRDVMDSEIVLGNPAKVVSNAKK
ncbi:MAG: acetyltransferase [Cyclobacteriaceae bacterium]